MIDRVTATPQALALIEQLKARHGAIFFYQAGGCCEGSAPMCYAEGDMTLMPDDRLLGRVSGVPFHVSLSQCEYLMGVQLTLDVSPGSLGTFSLEDADGHHFVARTRLWTDDEWRALEAQASGVTEQAP
ncbi:DUF779 domain-containing protein [Aquabacterium lacunae]|uniref:DUF779 domain-containing protein n=1 Tax=Aquabacterium lacunae TaxID=2528630 RepID=A0A4Q9H1Z4_9BURK|nr:DUF779 domain-containing protein [Aquabacterium lacunae]TBO34209.1 DUF779 domain-containing protein [Aquabacterium lacunae]